MLANSVDLHMLCIVQFIQCHYYLSILTLLLGIFLANGIYNAYFHGIHHVHGPFLGRFTDFYKVYIFACKHIPSATMELHRRYGKFRFKLYM